MSLSSITPLLVKRLSPLATIPSRGSKFAAGYDLSSAYDSSVPARGKSLIKTDLSVAVPTGHYGRVAPRSGLALKNGIDVGAGVIDEDYRGPVSVILFNHSDVDFTIKAGDRIAQLILERISTPEILEVEDLDATLRGEGGFGSTGVSSTIKLPKVVYKIMSVDEYKKFESSGIFEGTELDKKDGYIHMCQSKEQVQKVLDKFYQDEVSVYKLLIDPLTLKNLKFEASKSGTEIYPHEYGSLNINSVMVASLI